MKKMVDASGQRVFQERLVATAACAVCGVVSQPPRAHEWALCGFTLAAEFRVRDR